MNAGTWLVLTILVVIVGAIPSGFNLPYDPLCTDLIFSFNTVKFSSILILDILSTAFAE